MLLQVYGETTASRWEPEPSPGLRGLGCPVAYSHKLQVQERTEPGKDKPQARGSSLLWLQGVSLLLPGLAKTAAEGGSLHRPSRSVEALGALKPAPGWFIKENNNNNKTITHDVYRPFTQAQWVRTHAWLVLTVCTTAWHGCLHSVGFTLFY